VRVGIGLNIPQNSAGSAGETRKIVAEKLGVAHPKVTQAAAVVKATGRAGWARIYGVEVCGSGATEAEPATCRYAVWAQYGKACGEFATSYPEA